MIRTAVLASLLALTFAWSAAAADRWARPAGFAPAAPRDCGANGFALPGSADCVRLSGTVAVTTTLRMGGSAAAAPARPAGLFAMTRAYGRLAADVRVPTDFGPVRIYTAIRATGPAR